MVFPADTSFYGSNCIHEAKKLVPPLAALGDTWVRRVTLGWSRTGASPLGKGCRAGGRTPAAASQLSPSAAAPGEGWVTADGQESHLRADTDLKTLQNSHLTGATVLPSYFQGSGFVIWMRGFQQAFL